MRLSDNMLDVDVVERQMSSYIIAVSVTRVGCVVVACRVM